MLFFNNPQKKVQKIIKNMEKGKLAESDMIFIKDAIGKEPSMLPDITGSLTKILYNDNPKALNAALCALNVVADNDIGLVSRSLDSIAGCLKRDLRKEELLVAQGILYKIFKNQPERMNTAVPELINCLQNMDSVVREKAYFLLAPIAGIHPEFYNTRSKELIRALNGLNEDSRIYTCRLIGKIAEKDPVIVRDTYDDLKYLYLNHKSRELRLEAAAAMRKLKVDEMTEHTSSSEPKINYIADDKEMQALDSLKSEFIELIKPKGEDLKNTLTALGLEHMINETAIKESKASEISIVAEKKESGIGEEDKKTLEAALEKTISSTAIKSAMVIDIGGNVVALSGPPIDTTLISNLREMFSFEIKDKFRSRISLERENDKIVAVRLGMKAILVVMTDANIPIGAVIFELNKSIEKIDELGDF